MDETPVYLASILERFLDTYRGARDHEQAQRHKDPALLSV
jgi:hypothetical protein